MTLAAVTTNRRHGAATRSATAPEDKRAAPGRSCKRGRQTGSAPGHVRRSR